VSGPDADILVGNALRCAIIPRARRSTTGTEAGAKATDGALGRRIGSVVAKEENMRW